MLARAQDGERAVAAGDGRATGSGSRLLHGMAVSRKYMHRVRWSKLPAVVAILRSCADAPARRACDSTA